MRDLSLKPQQSFTLNSLAHSLFKCSGITVGISRSTQPPYQNSNPRKFQGLQSVKVKPSHLSLSPSYTTTHNNTSPLLPTPSLQTRFGKEIVRYRYM